MINSNFKESFLRNVLIQYEVINPVYTGGGAWVSAPSFNVNQSMQGLAQLYIRPLSGLTQEKDDPV